jgi:large subunit ribosomal protein L23
MNAEAKEVKKEKKVKPGKTDAKKIEAPAAKDYAIITRPVLSEKTTGASAHNQVVFQVATQATKPEIRAAIEKLFKVKVTAVNTNIRKGKTKLFRGRPGFRPDVKYAYVTLAEGQSIDVATGI